MKAQPGKCLFEHECFPDTSLKPMVVFFALITLQEDWVQDLAPDTFVRCVLSFIPFDCPPNSRVRLGEKWRPSFFRLFQMSSKRCYLTMQTAWLQRGHTTKRQLTVFFSKRVTTRPQSPTGECLEDLKWIHGYCLNGDRSIPLWGCVGTGTKQPIW